MTYEITAKQVNSITDVEVAFSTMRFLPPREVIPDSFWEGNTYTGLADAIFFGWALPALSIDIKDGIGPEALRRCVEAHLQSWGPQHEHKIAGVGYMISCMATLTPTAGRT